MLALCDKLKEGDVDENIRHLKYKIELLSKSATEQIEEKAESEETPSPVVDIKRRQPSPAPPQPERTIVTKSEPSRPSLKEFDTSTQETDTSKLLESISLPC